MPADSAFWRILLEDFEKLQATERRQGHRFSLILNLSPRNGRGEPRKDTDYVWDTHDSSLKVRLDAMALRGARAFGYDSEYAWYDQLRVHAKITSQIRCDGVVPTR
jgi:hypothetical protein